MKLRLYDMMERCVSEGVSEGFSRARQRTVPPSQSELESDIVAGVMAQFERWFVFDKPEGVFRDPDG